MQSQLGHFRSAPQAVFERVNREAVILDTQSETYFALNEAGASVWEVLTTGGSVAEAAEQLADQYGIALDQAHADADALVRHLLSQRLIQRLP